MKFWKHASLFVALAFLAILLVPFRVAAAGDQVSKPGYLIKPTEEPPKAEKRDDKRREEEKRKAEEKERKEKHKKAEPLPPPSIVIDNPVTVVEFHPVLGVAHRLICFLQSRPMLTFIECRPKPVQRFIGRIRCRIRG